MVCLETRKRYYLGELSRFVDTDYQSVYHIKWRCNLSRAPWWDGHFEGLVGVMKQAIYKSIGRGNLRWKELEKVLQNVETTVNNQPLSYEDDVQMPILTMQFTQPTQIPEEEPAGVENIGLRKRARYLRR